MRKRIGALVLLQISICFFTNILFAQFAGGTGEAADPYQIVTHIHLNNVRNYLNNSNVHFVLMNDIDLSDECNVGGAFYNDGQRWLPIGDNAANFKGKFNGNGHVINGLIIFRPDYGDLGLFGRTNGSVISNLGVTNVDITGGVWSVGGLVGYNVGHIENCFSTGTVTATILTASRTGGLVGYHGPAFTIMNCYSSVNVAGYDRVGGLIGKVGGGMFSSDYVMNSYSTGNVTGTSRVGGLIGRVHSYVEITNCYSTGNVGGTSDVGGLIGLNWGDTYNCYWNTQTSGQNFSDGGNGRSTLEMTYPYASNTYQNWDFNQIWMSDANSNMNNGYPYLFWQSPSIPATLSLNDITMAFSDTECFAATESIIASNFVVQNGGSAYLVSQGNVILGEGTSVEAGGYLHAWIDDNATYCDFTIVVLASQVEDFVNSEKMAFINKDDFTFKVYPNPSSGCFTIEFINADEDEIIYVEVFDMTGECVLHRELSGASSSDFDLSSMPGGIYLLRILQGSTITNGKIIRQ
ncbi:MAG: T9SS type A sorting domain-containing protein [Bacteroidales bacterium]|nr:T9SS type A sorting domain-containing protein [Bacteroidales bacterium]